MRKHSLMLGAALTALFMAALVAPSYLKAESAAPDPVSNESEEAVVTSPSDDALTRAAKLRRAWVTYREADSAVIYAITKAKQKRAVQTLDFFTAFNANYHIMVVAKGRLDRFPTGDPITSASGLNPDDFIKAPWRWRLVKVEGNPAVYLISPDGKKRVVIAEGVFHRFGWEFRDVEVITQAELDSYPADASVTDDTVFQEEVEVDTTHKRLTKEGLLKRLMLKGRELIRQRLVKAIGSNDVYIIMADGTRRKILSEAVANRLKLNLKEITEVTPEELAAIPEAAPIDISTVVPNLNLKAED